MIAIDNRGHWAWVPLRAALVLPLWAGLLALVGAVDFYGERVARTELPAQLSIESGQIPSRVLSARGFVIGGLERGGGEWTAFGDMSDAFVRAIVASEDARFFYHPGFDPEGILRAARQNVRAGDAVQGGSTITQQLAKSFVGDARTFDRKLDELAVARRIEHHVDKHTIFEAYANKTYFGAGAYGVRAAARVYFGTTPDTLTVAQSALLAALVPAPGRYNPFTHPDAALERRDRVLERMRDTGFATSAEVETARATPISLARHDDQRVRAVAFEREAWRELEAVSDARDWRRGDRAVQTSGDLVRQRVAERAMRDHLYALDQRQGLRETVGVVAPERRDAFEAAWRAHADAWGDVAPALVTAVSERSVEVWSGDTRTLETSAWAWATPYRDDARGHDATLDDARDGFAVGDVVWLHRALGVVQFPRVEAAHVAVDVDGGHIEALIGGFDPERSEFNRATQGCRQPGSTFKPLVYSAALDGDYTPATMLRDGPMRVVLGPNEEWRPRNADGGFEGHITLWQALIWSRNLPTLTVFDALGSGPTIRRARELGISTPMASVNSLALGASCVVPAELVIAYNAFADGGVAAEPRLVTLVESPRDGADLAPLDPTHAALDAGTRTERLWETRAWHPDQRIGPGNAFQVGWLLSEVTRAGTASEVRLPFPFAGKTGTTNAFDAWFAGFTSRDVSVTWIGSDRNTRPLGRSETGGHVALPAWADAQLPPAYEAPLLGAPPRVIEWADIEPESGRLAPDDRWAVSMPFLRGTAPQRTALTTDRTRRIQIDRLEREF